MDKARILIVGAGVSGLATARHLCNNGFKNIKIFEARDRIGGRVCSKKFDSGIIEFGAQWIHGQKDNNVYDICQREHLVDEDCQHFLAKFNEFHQIKSPRHKELMGEASAYILELIDECQRLSLESRKTSSKVAPSLRHFLEERFSKKFLEDTSISNEDKNIYSACLHWALRLQNEINGCSDTNQVSANFIGDYIECDGNNLTELGPQGYNAFLNYLSSSLPSESICLNTDVTHIDYSKTTITVTTSGGKTHEFDHVICTIPLGVLRSRNNLFTPDLPQRKVLAINSMGFGAVDKIYLEFEEEFPFWEEGEVFQVLWLDEHKKKLEDPKWYHSIGRINAVRNQKRLLVCWISGDGAKEMESLPDQEVILRSHEILGMVLEREDLPKPIAVHKSTWYTDPYSQGSYSFISVDCDTNNCLPCDIAQPILGSGDRPIICFAGEATSDHFYSTVHGAFDSGVREADRLIRFYQQLARPAGANAMDVIPDISKLKLSDRHYRTIIVGAGASGLSCGLRLSESGFDDFIILEAMDRPGGRVNSHYYDKGYVEFGASWVHGQEGNPMYEFTNKHDLIRDPKIDYSVEGQGHFLCEDGNEIDEELVENALLILHKVRDGFSEYADATDEEYAKLGYKSAGEMYRGEYTEYLKSINKENDLLMWSIFDWFWKFEIVDNACRDPNTLSIKGYGDYVECPGEYHINLKRGYSSVIRKLCSMLPFGTIKLNSPVRQIEWSEISKTINLICDKQVYTCDHVIITCSIGFLRHNPSLFKPALPKFKQQAFNGIGFNTIDKIFLYWDQPFFTPSDYGFQFLWHKYDEEFFEKHGSYLKGFYGFEKVHGNPNVLIGWIGGDHALQMEASTDEEVMEGCYQLLKRFVSKKCGDITPPCRIYRSSWYRNEYIRGSYSHRILAFDDVTDPVEALQRPITDDKDHHPLILFAGEATDKIYFSTVHGAMRAGYREAERLVKFWRQPMEKMDGAIVPN